MSGVVLRGLPREVAGVIRRWPLTATLPAAVLGIGADAIMLLRHHIGAEILLGVILALAFELYVGFAELIVAADRGHAPHPSMRTVLRRAVPFTPALLVASVAAVTLPLAATPLLVIPGFWLLTRWSLFAPAIVHERLRPAASLRRSADLVRGAFWPVACSVSLSVLIEHAIIHATAHTAEPALGSLLLGLLGAAMATTLVSPPAAFTISIVYERLEHAAAHTRACLPADTGGPPSRPGAIAAG
jgi:hypothetical protein